MPTTTMRKTAISILLSIIVLQGPLLAPAGHADSAGKKLVVCIEVKPMLRLEINREMISKLIAEYIRRIGLRPDAKQFIAQIRLTKVEGRIYTELIPLENYQ